MFGFGFFDSVFPVLFTVMFVLVLGTMMRICTQATRPHGITQRSRSKAATGWNSASRTATTAIS